MTITYSKLNSGDWGIRGRNETEPPPVPGTKVTVLKKDGKVQHETVDRVLVNGLNEDGTHWWIASVTVRQKKDKEPQREGWEPREDGW